MSKIYSNTFCHDERSLNLSYWLTCYMIPMKFFLCNPPGPPHIYKEQLETRVYWSSLKAKKGMQRLLLLFLTGTESKLCSFAFSLWNKNRIITEVSSMEYWICNWSFSFPFELHNLLSVPVRNIMINFWYQMRN